MPKDLHKLIWRVVNFNFLSVLFIKPGKSGVTDQIYQHMIWTFWNTELYKSIVANNIVLH